ncbi:hypothetical protein QN277_007926 [Acacia crassicarpa]|uniref:Leucine-rich repeat-containing N-terminal plant-type domain-containing protein n=2 Tax=Acacia crassicarpa TaxID=499986 RepID=A0AAE1IPH0_9FABA|nr:hypothetical protein QN277_007926 [Acacia crassicarpa]
MAKYSKTSHFPLYPILTITLCFVASPALAITLQSDTDALREIKGAIDPNSISSSSYLRSWDFSVDPCESSGSYFLGILCRFPLDNSSSRITTIDLDGAGYDAFIPQAIGNLSETTVLNLRKNNFRGPIPDTIGNMRKLTRLDMSNNFLTGSLPAQIWNIKSLNYLDLSGNELSGAIPARVSGLRSLTYLSLSNNAFGGTIPSLTGLWQLNTADLSNNQLFGEFPLLPVSLRTVRLSQNILSGHITPLTRLKLIRWIDLSDNRLSGSITTDVLSLPRLVHLNISFNRFTALEVANNALEDTHLQVLDAKGNHISGRLPVNLATFKYLSAINLARNQFSGFIPNEYGAKVQRSWKRLYLDNNFLTGNLPREFNHMRIRGSLANNCLNCPPNVVLCRGGQRPATECVRQNNYQL